MNEPKKRGGQPGNTNAVKSGRYLGRFRHARREIRACLQRAEDAIARVEETYGIRIPRKRRRRR